MEEILEETELMGRQKASGVQSYVLESSQLDLVYVFLSSAVADADLNAESLF